MTREVLYGFIAAEKTTYPVGLLCRALQVSTSSFYDWIRRGSPAVSTDDLDDAHAANHLRTAWVAHRRSYGARWLTAEINDRRSGAAAWNRKRVARLMRLAGIEGIHRRRRGKKRIRLDRLRPHPARLARAGRRARGRPSQVHDPTAGSASSSPVVSAPRPST